jgi:hypothetical protein
MRSIHLVALLVALSALPACGLGPSTAVSRAGLAPQVRVAGHAAARAEEGTQDLTLLREVGDGAAATLGEMEARYAALGLNTAAGRKITPAREAPLKAGLAPLIGEVDARIANWLGRLQADGRYGVLCADLVRRRPSVGEPLAEDAGAADMLYRLAQHRLKLGVLIEYAAREGAVVD